MKNALVLLGALTFSSAASAEVRLDAHLDVFNSVVPRPVSGPGLAIQGGYYFPFGLFIGGRVYGFVPWETFVNAPPPPLPRDSRFTGISSLRLDAQATLGYEYRFGPRWRVAAGAQAGVRSGFEAATFTDVGETVRIAHASARFAAHAMVNVSVAVTDRLALSLLLRAPIFGFRGEIYETSFISIGMAWRW